MTFRYVLIIFATGLTSFLTTYLSSSVNLAMKTIGEEYLVSPSELSLLASLYLLFSSIFIVPFGKLSDTIGSKKTLVFGCGFFVITNLLVTVFARDFTSLLVLRSLQGVASAFLVVSNTPIISVVIPKEYQVTAMGILSGLIYFGNSAGNFVGGLLTEEFGWRSIFISAAAMGAVAFILIQLMVPRSKVEKEPGRGVDVAGMVFYGLMLLSLQSGANQLDTPVGKLLLGGFVAFAVLFVMRQYRSSRPVYDVRMFLENRVFAAANVSVYLNFFATTGTTYLLALHLQCNRGMSATEAGGILLLQPLMQLFVSPVAGYISDKTSAQKVSSVGMGFIAAALLILSMISEEMPLYFIYTSLVLIGIGISLFSAPNISIILGSVPANRKGMAAASNSLMRNLGMQTSFIAAGSAFLLFIGKTDGIPASSYDEMLLATKTCFIIFAILSSVGVFISLMRKPKEKVEAVSA